MSEETKKRIEEATLRNIPFWVCLCISITLMVAGFIVPPTGEIDGSVLKGIGELFGFAALYTVWLAIKRGVDAKVQHGNTSLTIGDIDGAPMPQMGAGCEETDSEPEDPG
jgi:hypothetical protein